MGSVGSSLAHSGMDAIKKKMQAMKVEKDNACDKMDACEEAMKTAKIRAQKGEDEVAELDAKAKQLETELDLTAEKLGYVSLQLEEKECCKSRQVARQRVSPRLSASPPRLSPPC